VTALAIAAYITGAYWFTASTSFANPAVTIARSFSEVAAEAIETLIDGAAAETSWVGIGLTAGTLVICRGSVARSSASVKGSARVRPTASGERAGSS
jgi:hypothetical protein